MIEFARLAPGGRLRRESTHFEHTWHEALSTTYRLPDKRTQMRKALPQMLDLSRALIARETGGMQFPAAAARDVCEKLRPTLSTLMGATGFRALLARALALASAEVPALGTLEINSAALLVYPAISEEADRTHDIEGDVVLVAQLLSLLAAFIGEKLTRQILLEVWPQSLAHCSNFQTGEGD